MTARATKFDLRTVINSNKKNAKIILAVLCDLCRHGYIHYNWGWRNRENEKFDEDQMTEISNLLCKKVERFVNLFGERESNIGRLRVTCNLDKHEIWISETIAE
ncbi:MAG: hypothetical protein IJ889_00660 [Eubacterium sp.]|nr:hypothetical protein [Eubacterium sp.]MBR2247427.1 hypothetical protein [Bacilli bacterium]